jgi:hypothetical protein
MTQVFHKDAYGLPKWFRKPTGVIRPTYSLHAKQAAAGDRYGYITLPETIDLAKFETVEVYLDTHLTNKVSKAVIRGPLDKYRDLVLVIHPDGFVRTVWVNLRSDKHFTLNVSKFSKP